jgi:signal transduction histidine kinase
MSSQRLHSPVLQYGFAIVSVVVAILVALAFQYEQLHGVELPVLTMAIALTTWYAGLGPAVVAVALAVVCFDYFFIEPLYSFGIAADDLPYFLIFVAWTGIVASFSVVRRRIEIKLREALDVLEEEVEARKRREEDVRALNAELAKRADALEAANKELESFSYSVSHDLRAPLRHVVGYSELLQKQAAALLDEKSNRYIRTILESGRKMGNLIDDLLAFSRIGRAETRTTALDLPQIVKEAIAEVEPEAQGREIVWDVGALPVCYGDRAMLRLVVVNLLSNAVKFTRNRNPAKIEIGYSRHNDNEVEVFIKDNGAGFDMRYVDKLFGVFQRLHIPDEFEGTGIGLASVQRVIHRHGGTVRAEGVVEQGATFYFSLPNPIGAAPWTKTNP